MRVNNIISLTYSSVLTSIYSNVARVLSQSVHRFSQSVQHFFHSSLGSTALRAVSPRLIGQGLVAHPPGIFDDFNCSKIKSTLLKLFQGSGGAAQIKLLGLTGALIFSYT